MNTDAKDPGKVHVIWLVSNDPASLSLGPGSCDAPPKSHGFSLDTAKLMLKAVIPRFKQHITWTSFEGSYKPHKPHMSPLCPYGLGASSHVTPSWGPKPTPGFQGPVASLSEILGEADDEEAEGEGATGARQWSSEDLQDKGHGCLVCL